MRTNKEVKFLPKSELHHGSSRAVCRRWSRRERYLLILCALFFILCIVFVAIALTRDMQLRSKLSRNTSNNVCMRKSCISTAAQLMAGMDFSADPCHDFFQFACGTWNRKHVIPEDKPTFNTFDKLHDELQIIMRDLLEKQIDSEDSEATKKAKIFYASCTNVSQVETMGSKPLKTIIDSLGGWPILDSQWSENGFVLEEVLGRMRKLYGPFLWKCGVGADDKNSAVNIIQIDQMSLGMPSREYFLMEEHRHHVQAYRNFIVVVVGLLGVSGTQVEKDVDEILEFETKIANVTRPYEERQDTGALYHKMKIKELQQLIPTTTTTMTTTMEEEEEEEEEEDDDDDDEKEDEEDEEDDEKEDEEEEEEEEDTKTTTTTTTTKMEE
ncbi:endothelin-converting enzyme 1 [Plakobranchus ocellatus]|uniref:Endothelin-converting enzyme 1 n=1 Tax=Plakobranchus ocellatus TaxID=259542 RepID=A0AAV3Y2C6_9GAST|nr:endothelin-converting enzyme 1 [Plakobranchus ocellatus]